MTKKNVNNAYNIFEAHIKSPDECIIRILSTFKDEDYLKSPIIFDLVTEKKIKVLEHLYKKGVPFTYQDAADANALHVACGVSGSFEVVKLLTENDIFTNINAKTDEGETPFLLAVMYNHHDIVNYFLQNFNPDLSIRTINGETVFSLAKKADNLEMLSLLEAKRPELKNDIE